MGRKINGYVNCVPTGTLQKRHIEFKKKDAYYNAMEGKLVQIRYHSLILAILKSHNPVLNIGCKILVYSRPQISLAYNPESYYLSVSVS